jgi:hypothetical protein
MEIIVLFGEMGGGKNYWGERIAAQKGYHFYDGDAAAPPIVVERVMQFKMLRRDCAQHTAGCQRNGSGAGTLFRRRPKIPSCVLTGKRIYRALSMDSHALLAQFTPGIFASEGNAVGHLLAKE